MDYSLIIFTSLVLLAIIITRPFAVLFRELGHAITAIILTRRSVSIYIGSYGNPKNSLHFNIGLLGIWVRYNPLSWCFVLCVTSTKEISINKQIIITLTGYLTSFLIATIACYFTFYFDLHGSIKLILIVFLGSSIFDLSTNLIAMTKTIKLYDGKLTYIDGYQLKEPFYYKKISRKQK